MPKKTIKPLIKALNEAEDGKERLDLLMQHGIIEGHDGKVTLTEGGFKLMILFLNFIPMGELPRLMADVTMAKLEMERGM